MLVTKTPIKHRNTTKKKIRNEMLNFYNFLKRRVKIRIYRNKCCLHGVFFGMRFPPEMKWPFFIFYFKKHPLLDGEDQLLLQYPIESPPIRKPYNKNNLNGCLIIITFFRNPTTFASNNDSSPKAIRTTLSFFDCRGSYTTRDFGRPYIYG